MEMLECFVANEGLQHPRLHHLLASESILVNASYIGPIYYTQDKHKIKLYIDII